jgi:primosomal protein N' (replication factor Y)
MAVVSGPAAAAYVERLGTPPNGVEVRGPADGRWQVLAADHDLLSETLGAVSRPPGRLRIEVDPLRL